jgi:hypothetical protein
VPPMMSQDATTVRALRRGVGVIGMALPFAVTVGNAIAVRHFVLLGSISGSYYTAMRDVFVGSLCAIGVFLICYRYDKPDDALSTVAGCLAIVVALCRTTPDTTVVAVSTADRVVGYLHEAAAGLLFLVLAGFCLALFTRTAPGAPAATPRKRVRNAVYYTCGSLILLALVGAGAGNLLPESTRESLRPLFWCESVAVVAFGVAWFIKGETLLRDGAGAGPAE